MGLLDLFKSKEKNECQTAEKNATVSFDVLRDDGVRAMKMGEVAFAAKCFEAALERQEDPTTLSYLAEAQIRLQAYDQARPSLEKLVECAPDNLTLWLLLSKTLGKLEDYAAMKTTSEKAMQLDATSGEAKYYAADAAFHLGDPFNAIALLTQAIQLNDQLAEAYALRAKILCAMGQYQEALKDTTQLVQLQEDEDYILQHATTLAAAGQTDDALQLLEKLLEYNPFQQEAILAIADLYVSSSHYDKALEVLDQAIELQPDFAKAYKARGGIKLHLNDKAGAASDLKKSLEISPELIQQIEGAYSTLENQLNDRYKAMNPYQF